MNKKTIIADLQEAFRVLYRAGDDPNAKENIHHVELIVIDNTIKFLKGKKC